MKIISVVGARPNFMKIAPIIRAINRHNQDQLEPVIHNLLVHTGQHYDYQLSRVFFEDLDLPEPDVYLGIGSGTHAEQTGKTLIELEKVLIKEQPDLVLVVGDVNSTLAATLAAIKLQIPVAHIEAGLRSFDRSMPEEINRLLTDRIADYLFTPSEDADANLLNEGINRDNIFLVGNVMIDSLLHHREQAGLRRYCRKVGLSEKKYCILTIHRPENADNENNLKALVEAVKDVSREIDVIFPCHPRTRKMIGLRGLDSFFNPGQNDNTELAPQRQGFKLIDPLGYLDFLSLTMDSLFVITDSGGLQEETTFLGIPCLTLRNSTERPVTVSEGTNILIGRDLSRLNNEIAAILNGNAKTGRIPRLWDGHAAERIIEIIAAKHQAKTF